MDYSFYKNLYFDLKNFNNEQLKHHYMKYGAWEGRICNKQMMSHKIKKIKLYQIIKIHLLMIIHLKLYIKK